MPGSSLWLLPPTDNPLNELLTDLIEATSDHFHSAHRFLPHITLTSEIPASIYGSDPISWLNSLDFSSCLEVVVIYEKLNSDDVFFRKLYIQVHKTPGLVALAAICRQAVPGHEEEEKAEKWAAKEYRPHLSLLYHDCPKADDARLSDVERIGKGRGFDVGSLRWTGGRVVLVPTDKPIDQWVPVAQRAL